LRAPSPVIRHRRTGRLVTETIPGCRWNQKGDELWFIEDNKLVAVPNRLA
jgi:hypothetical protein